MFFLVSQLVPLVFASGQLLNDNSNLPRFNIFTPYVHTQTDGRDYYLFDAKNDTKQTGWGFPVSADPGDVLTFSVYYHNAVLESAAKNTKMRVILPSSAGLSQMLSAALWSDNSSNASLGSPLTQNLSVNFSSIARLEEISGSVKWYPDQRDWRVDAPVSFPFGQSGEELFSSNGLNVGDINGCWEYSGYLIFKARVTGETAPTSQSPDLSIVKNVRNPNSSSGWSKGVNARNGEHVQFRVEVRNTGNTLLTDVYLRDALPPSLNYVSSSVRLDGLFVSDYVFNEGINIGSLAAGVSRVLTFEATVNTSDATATLTNVAFAKANQVGEKSNWAGVYAYSSYTPYYPYYYSQPYVPVPVSQPTPSSLLKQVSNLTRPNGTSYENTALIGDQLEYNLSYTNYGSVTLSNVQIIDILPAYTSFVGASNSGIYNASQNLIAWQIGSLAPGVKAEAVYRVSVQSVPSDGFVIANTALFKAASLEVTSNEVRTKVSLPVVKGEVIVKAVTGADLLTRNLVFSFIFSLFFVGLAYLVSRKKMSDLIRLRWAILKARVKEF